LQCCPLRAACCRGTGVARGPGDGARSRHEGSAFRRRVLRARVQEMELARERLKVEIPTGCRSPLSVAW
jgi:hypothetical protein